ncbi:ATP-dependent Clp protease proteolytic subunit [Ktedonobacter sp. SOSP1-52]|uniref:ATP-dependent Clp protease proteolytic subunit n=1 Tax=Ktedonobacter sp. SOSP1-52 TaxID=2778366 RepID=UPI001F2229B0|nr:ATP-dependent Clp protease proteolytic subunit [Ktedonobacter sp. SOSP1-52]
MFTGEVTWRSGVLAREVLSSYEPQDTAIPPLPAELVTLLARCFASRPEDRPATMLEVATTLQEIYAHEMGRAYPREAPQAAKLQADSLNNRALSLYDLGKIEEAKQIWEQALQIDPQHLETTYNRGIILWRQGELTDDRLLLQLETARASCRHRWQADRMLAQVHLEQGAVDKALPLLREASNQAPTEKEVQKLFTLAQAQIKDAINYPYPLTFHVDTHFVAISLSLSANGHWLAASSGNGIVRLWEASKGRCMHTLQSYSDRVETACLSADGRWLASGSEHGTVCLWEVNTGRRVHILQSHTDRINAISLSADGHWLVSGSTDKTIRLWEVSTGRCVHTVVGHTGSVTSVSLSADGHWLASGSADTTIRLWEVSTGRCLYVFQDHTTEVTSVSLSADGRWLVSADRRAVRLWEVHTRRCIRTFEGHIRSVTSVSLSADGRWLVSTDRRAVRLWEVHTGRCLRTLQEHTSRADLLPPLSLSADGNWLASGSQEVVYLWKLNDSDFSCTFYPSLARSYTDVAQTEHHASQLIKQAEQALREKHFSVALHLLRQLRALPGWERHPESKEAWNKLSDVCLRSSLHASWLTRTFNEKTDSVHLSADTCLFAAGNADKTIRLWEVSTGRCVRTFVSHDDRVKTVSLSADGHWLVSGSADKTIRLWEVSTGRCVRMFMGHDDDVIFASLYTDGRWLVSSSRDKTMRLWEVSTGRCVRIIQGHFTQVSMSIDGCWLISSGKGGIVSLWEMSTGRCLRTFEDPTGLVDSVSLSTDGRWFATASGDHAVHLWEVSTGRCVRTFVGHTGLIYTVRLSADGRWLVSGSIDKTMRLWEVSTGRCVRTFEGHVLSMSMSTDGRWLVSRNAKNIQLWELDWELEAHASADWDEGARPYLETFLTQHTPYAAELPQEREPTEQEIQQALTRQGTPSWNEEDFQRLIQQMQYVGYGWLRPEGVLKQLTSMVRERQSPSHPLNEKGKRDNDKRMVGQDLFSQSNKTNEQRLPDMKWTPTADELQKILKRQNQQMLEGPYKINNNHLPPHLAHKRIISIDTPIEETTAQSVITQLFYLQNVDATRDIHLYLNSPGGNIYAGLAIYDAIQSLQPAVATYCLGQARGFAALLLAAGKKGQRYALPTSTIGLTQVSIGDNPADIEITAREILRLRRLLIDLFVEHTRQNDATIREDMDRGIALSAKDAITYGFVDRVIDSLEEPAKPD